MLDEKKLDKLYKKLDEAEILLKEFRGGYSNQFFSAEEFYTSLVESIRKLKLGETDQLKKLYVWFAPTCDWDDFIGLDGQDLGNVIFEIIAELQRN